MYGMMNVFSKVLFYMNKNFINRHFKTHIQDTFVHQVR